MTALEIQKKLGKEIATRYAWMNHNVFDNLKEVGETTFKNRVRLNQTFSRGGPEDLPERHQGASGRRLRRRRQGDHAGSLRAFHHRIQPPGDPAADQDGRPGPDLQKRNAAGHDRGGADGQGRFHRADHVQPETAADPCLQRRHRGSPSCRRAGGRAGTTALRP